MDSDSGETHPAQAYADAVLTSLPGTFYHLDATGRMLHWNRNLERVTGYDAAELRAMQPLDFFPDDEKERVAAAMEVVYRHGEAQIEADFLTKDGRRLRYLLTGVRLTIDGEQQLIGIGTDIDAHSRAEAETRQALARLRSQLESTLEGVLVVDRHERRVMQNARMAELWGIPPEIANDPDLSVQFEFAARRTVDPEGFKERIRWLAAHPEEVADDEIELVDGTVLERYSAVVFDEDGSDYGRVWVHRDVTERRRTERRLAHVATHDLLTGLPNRYQIQQRTDEAIARVRGTGRLVALLDLDLDRFKVVNDGYGHPFGDAVIAAVARRLTDVIGEQGMVARHGGDEFVVLLPAIDGLADAFLIAERLLACLEEPLCVDGRDVHLAGSIGLSAFPHDGDDAQQLIDNADVAMYRAKAQGGRTVAPFTQRLGREIQQRIELERGLRTAAEEGQLRLVYQPKVSLLTGEVLGCEALLRWDHPELGAVPPSELIPIAEDSGLIVPIGDWVLQTACQQAVAWVADGLPPVRVAVNLSARQLLRHDIVAWVTRTLRTIGLPAAQLELELTESVLAQNVEHAIATFAQLRRLGVRLAIDDFGTGYSSLAYLKRFKVDTLKVDRSFVGNMLTEPDDALIVQAIISLGRSLGLEVVAEGVETAEQLAFLREHGCAEMQGYLFSKPVPPEEFAELLRSGRRLG